MKLYKIRDWDSLYENNRSRQVKDLSWVPIQNKLDGENFSMIMSHQQGAVIFSSFILMVEVASRCTPRGTLVRGNGLPHDVRSMSAKCRCPDVWFRVGFDYLEKHTDWLIVEEVTNGRQEGDVEASGQRQSGDEEQKGMEGNGKEGIEPEKPPCKKEKILTDSKEVLAYLNIRSKKQFRECESSLTPIVARLSEPDVTVVGVKLMIDRQVKMWGSTEMAEYLRPATLFGKEKFNGYYAARELEPVVKTNGHASVTPMQRKIALEGLIANHPARAGSATGAPTPDQRADYRKLKADLETVNRIIAAGGRP